MTVVVVVGPDEENMREEGCEAEYKQACGCDGTESSTRVVTISSPRRRNPDRLDQRRRLVDHFLGFGCESGR